jgi:hypothetical protein
MLIRLRQHLTYANVGTTIALVLGAGGFAVAAAPQPTTNVVRACVSTHGGLVRLRAAGTKCRKTERPMSWNRRGPSGAFTGYPRAESDARYLEKAGKAADADKLDGLDSTELLPSRRFAGNTPRSPSVGDENTGAGCVLGGMAPFGGTAPPTGWSFAHGQEARIADHVQLFSVLGTRYGGNGSTTFALPDAYDLGPGGTNWLICTGGQVVP